MTRRVWMPRWLNPSGRNTSSTRSRAMSGSLPGADYGFGLLRLVGIVDPVEQGLHELAAVEGVELLPM